MGAACCGTAQHDESQSAPLPQSQKSKSKLAGKKGGQRLGEPVRQVQQPEPHNGQPPPTTTATNVKPKPATATSAAPPSSSSVSAAEARARRLDRAAAAESRVRSQQKRRYGKGTTTTTGTGTATPGASTMTAGSQRASGVSTEEALLYGEIRAADDTPARGKDDVSPSGRPKTQWERENADAIGASIIHTAERA